MNHRRRHEKSWVVALICLIVLSTACSTSWATQISLGEYHLRIQESIELAEETEGKIQSEESSRFREMFPQDLMVKDPTGDLYPVDVQDFLRWLENGEECTEGRGRFISYAKSLSTQISCETSGLFQKKGGWRECKTALDNVYRGREFRNLVKTETPAWKKHVNRLLERLGRWLEDHLQALGGIHGKWIVFLTYGVVLILGGIVIIWIIRSFGPVAWRRKRPKSIPPPGTGSLPEKGWWAWREEAQKKAEQGAFREAIRFLFISVLVEGHQKGWWIYEPEATNREHLARVEDHRHRHEALQKLTELYELAWYGLTQPGKEAFLDCEKWTQRLEASA